MVQGKGNMRAKSSKPLRAAKKQQQRKKSAVSKPGSKRTTKRKQRSALQKKFTKEFTETIETSMAANVLRDGGRLTVMKVDPKIQKKLDDKEMKRKNKYG